MCSMLHYGPLTSSKTSSNLEVLRPWDNGNKLEEKLQFNMLNFYMSHDVYWHQFEICTFCTSSNIDDVDNNASLSNSTNQLAFFCLLRSCLDNLICSSLSV